MSHAHKLFLAGHWTETAEHTAVINPWDLSVIGDAPSADALVIEQAIATAASAVAMLRSTPTHQRRQWLERIAQLLTRDLTSIALLIAREAGKPIAFAETEVRRAIQTFTLGAEECTRLGGEVQHLDVSAALEHTVAAWTRVSSGVLLAITPFNFPLNLVAHKLAPAFALGMPVILKPAPQTPLTALRLAQIVEEAQVPGPMLSVLPTTNTLAQAMVQDPRINALSFTGSADVGWKLKSLADKKRVLLELGGNASVVLAPDADLTRVLVPLVTAAFAYAGQVCIKSQRVYVHRAMMPALMTALVERVSVLRASDPLERETLCGPMIDLAAADRVRRWVRDAVAQGAQIHCGMSGKHNRVDPAVVSNARPGMTLVDQELFGPVLTVHPYDSLADCFAEIEAGRYGLQCSLFTDSMKHVREAFATLSVGALIVNDTTSLRVDSMPYGGVKDSGLGREGVAFAIDELAEKKLLVLR
jgi:glyceraldehyde-3-phosphate dehydrogenase (NADP+)